MTTVGAPFLADPPFLEGSFDSVGLRMAVSLRDGDAGMPGDPGECKRVAVQCELRQSGVPHDVGDEWNQWRAIRLLICEAKGGLMLGLGGSLLDVPGSRRR